MEMDQRLCQTFDRITRQVAAVSFLQFIKCNSVPVGARVPSNQTGNCWAASAATSYPEDQEVQGLNLLRQDLRIENASTVLDPVTECMSWPPKELLESYAAS